MTDYPLKDGNQEKIIFSISEKQQEELLNGLILLT